MNEEQGRPDEAPEDSEGQAEAGRMVALTHAQYEELKALAGERDEYLKRLQRSVADYQNLQKRMERFREAWRQELMRSLVGEILPVADSLARALEAARQTPGGEKIVEGLKLVEKEFYGGLAKLDVCPMDAVGEPFDPHRHEAAMQEPAEGVAPGIVIRELKKGFVMGGEVMRPSQVVVSGRIQPQDL